jgi:hypothetical protein
MPSRLERLDLLHRGQLRQAQLDILLLSQVAHQQRQLLVEHRGHEADAEQHALPHHLNFIAFAIPGLIAALAVFLVSRRVGALTRTAARAEVRVPAGNG